MPSSVSASSSSNSSISELAANSDSSVSTAEAAESDRELRIAATMGEAEALTNEAITLAQNVRSTDHWQTKEAKAQLTTTKSCPLPVTSKKDSSGMLASWPGFQKYFRREVCCSRRWPVP